MSSETDNIRRAKIALETIYDSWTGDIPRDFILAGIGTLGRWEEELETRKVKRAGLATALKAAGTERCGDRDLRLPRSGRRVTAQCPYPELL